MPETLVPDTSVLVDGRISELVKSDFPNARVLVPLAALAELESQANRGLETGFTGMDELTSLQRMAELGELTVEFVGSRPSPAEIDRAETGAIDALIRDAAVKAKGIFVTSDRVQAHAAAAQGIRHHYVRPIVKHEPDLTELAVWRFFEDDVMSVHLKSDCVPMIKRGMPGRVSYEAAGVKEMKHPELRAIARELIEYARRDYNSFIELERHGCTVVQLGPMRITIAQPPFSDGLEITAVRPITKKVLADYELPPEIIERIEGHARGLLVAGQPGSGKSTFSAAVAEHLHELGRVVKTMEQPRDLQVPKEITQYGALNHDMAKTGEILLLVRPDHVIFDEVRTTDDFRTYADMRLAGVGLFGVSHANRPIDAIQRLIGRVDLGMIPQIVDTVLFIDAGQLTTILELSFTVKVPAGMMEADLARPVVLVRDVMQQKDVYELYTYGEQVVVMPLEGGGLAGPRATPVHSAEDLKRSLGRYARGDLQVEVSGNRAIVYAEEHEIPGLIGKGGRTVQAIEKRLGVRLDIQPMRMAPHRPRGVPSKAPSDPSQPQIRKTGSNIFLLLDKSRGSRMYRVEVEDAVIGEAKASDQGKLRFKLASPEGKAILKAQQAGLDIRCVPI